MKYSTPSFKKADPRTVSHFRLLWGILIGLLALNTVGLAQADDADQKGAISSWRSEGQVYPLNEYMDFYAGLMKGTFFVKDHTQKSHYMHAVRMDCPFSVHINHRGNDEMQGACQLTDQKGNKAIAKISCTGPKENCQGNLTFVSGTGDLKGIKGGGAMKIRVDLIKEESEEKTFHTFGGNMDASGYLIISDLQDNVSDEGGHPKVR